MNISIYQDFFHDGSIMNVEHVGSNLILTIGSAQVDTEDIKDDIILSSNSRIKGKLHIDRIETIIIDNQSFLGKMKQQHDHGDILELIIKKNFLDLAVEWIDFPPKPEKQVFSVIQVKAEKIYWENIPDLPD